MLSNYQAIKTVAWKKDTTTILWYKDFPKGTFNVFASAASIKC